jgi:hypothetical protein
MKHLKSFNESNNTNNESYFELVDILQSKVFDDYDVMTATDEDLNALNYTYHKFWLYNSNGKLIYPKDIGDKDISAIYVYNLKEDEHEEFLESLKSLENIVEDTIGKELYIKEDWCIRDENDYFSASEVYDYIIKLK